MKSYVTQLKQYISEVKTQFNPAFWKQSSCSVGIFKIWNPERREKLSRLEVKKLDNGEAKEQYNAYRGEINEIYDEISNGIKIMSKYDWYEFGEKSNKFFLTLEKRRATKNIIQKVLSNEQEITIYLK